MIVFPHESSLMVVLLPLLVSVQVVVPQESVRQVVPAFAVAIDRMATVVNVKIFILLS
jgi:hypothetical protein